MTWRMLTASSDGESATDSAWHTGQASMPAIARVCVSRLDGCAPLTRPASPTMRRIATVAAKIPSVSAAALDLTLRRLARGRGTRAGSSGGPRGPRRDRRRHEEEERPDPEEGDERVHVD